MAASEESLTDGMPIETERPKLMTLPLEIRLKIWSYAIPPYAEADCCEQASPASHRRILANPWYPSAVLPVFTHPGPRIPLRLINSQANFEIESHVPRPPLIARSCDFMCLRRAINVISYGSSSNKELDLAHFSGFKITSERISLFRPLYSTSGEESGFSVRMRSDEANNRARIDRLSESFIKELRHYYREVWLAKSE